MIKLLWQINLILALIVLAAMSAFHAIPSKTATLVANPVSYVSPNLAGYTGDYKLVYGFHFGDGHVLIDEMPYIFPSETLCAESAETLARYVFIQIAPQYGGIKPDSFVSCIPLFEAEDVTPLDRGI